MEYDASAWSTEDIVALIQQMSRASIEQFVREHPHLKKYALAGFSARLPNDYPQRIGRFLAQRAWPNQQDLQKLLERWRQDHSTACQATLPLELPLSLEGLAPLIQQYGGTAVFYALRTDPRAERLGEICAALKRGLEQGEIQAAPEPPAQAPGAGKATAKAPTRPTESAGAKRTPPTGETLGGSVVQHDESQASAPTKPTAELLSALEAQAHTLSAIDQTISAAVAQLGQPTTTHNPATLQRVIEKLSSAQQKLSDGLRQFAVLESDLLAGLRHEIQQAEAGGVVEGLTGLLPDGGAPASLDEARAHLQVYQQARERFNTALALHEQRRSALKMAPAVIERLLNEIEALEGETAPLRASLATLKTAIAERVKEQQIERVLQRAEQVQGRAISQRDGVVQSWCGHLQRACRDADLLLNQSLHLPTDVPEVTNLQRALEAARALLNTTLPLNTPAPLPFPPKQLMSSHQALRKHNERLRQALGAYNPQIALAALEDAEHALPTNPTHEQLRDLGAALVGAASLPAGYSGVIWRVGAALLMTLDHRATEQFYERYGYAAVATAVAASLRNRDFPQGLAFAEHLFYPGAEVGSVFEHARVVDLLSDACSTQTLPRLPAECFAWSTPAIRRAALAFLKQTSAFNLPEPLRLQMSAGLMAASTSPGERAQVGQVFIRVLLDQEQRLNAYCVWRALALEQPDLYGDQTGLETLYGLLWWLTLDTHAPAIHLADLCGDSGLQQAGFFVPGVALALCLGSLALARQAYPQSRELMPMFAEMLRDHHYPALSDLLLAQLPSQQDALMEQTSLEHQAREAAAPQARSEFVEALSEAERRIQVSNYRFAPTKQMRNQIDARVKPLIEALQQGENLASDLLPALETEDPAELARALIDHEEKARRQEGYGAIEGDDLRKLRKDLENVVKHLALAVQKRAQLVALGAAPSHQSQADADANHRLPNQPEDDHWQPRDEPALLELRRALVEIPQARDLLQRALPQFAQELS